MRQTIKSMKKDQTSYLNLEEAPSRAKMNHCAWFPSYTPDKRRKIRIFYMSVMGGSTYESKVCWFMSTEWIKIISFH